MRFSKFQVKHIHENRERHRKIDVALGTCWAKPSATNVVPMSRRKLSASILTVGRRSTKWLIRRQLSRQDRNENNVIYAEDQFKGG